MFKIKLNRLILIFLIVLIAISTVNAQDMNISDASPTLKNSNSKMFLDIQGAIDNANSGDTIYLNETTYAGSSQMTINKNLIIDGSTNGNKGLSTLNGQNQTRIFTIAEGVSVTFLNLNFINGNGEGGSAIFGALDGQITVKNCKFENNHILPNELIEDGGAILSFGDLTVIDSNFTGNSAKYGGAIYGEKSITVKNSNFNNNSATTDEGGAIYGIDSVTVDNCNFINNNAYKIGGAIISNVNTLNVKNSTFKNNTAQYGGAIYGLFDLKINVEDSIFINNKATQAGGAIYTQNQVNVNNSKFDRNTAKYEGGAIYAELNGNVIANKCNFTNNSLTGEGAAGGAIYSYDNVTAIKCNFDKNQLKNLQTTGGAIDGNIVTIIDSTFTNNQAHVAGAVFGYEKVIVKGSNFTNNIARENGGAIYGYDNSEISISNCNFNSNKANNREGGAILASTNLTVNNSNFTKNYANKYGGAISGNDAEIINCNFNENRAYLCGGAVYTKNGNLNIDKSKFVDNSADIGPGMAIYADNSFSKISNSDFSDKCSEGGSVIFIANNRKQLVNNNYDCKILAYNTENIIAIVNHTGEMKLGEKIPIIVYTPVDGNGKITNNLTSESYNVLNSKSIIEITAKKRGDYPVKITYSGNDVYSAGSGTVAFNVMDNLKLTSQNLTIWYPGKSSLNATLTNGGIAVENEKIEFTVNGVSTSIFTNDKGIACLPINLEVGNYNVEISCENITLNVDVTVLSTISGKDIVMYYKNGTQYEVKVLDSKGNPLINKMVPVTLLINGKTVTYNRATNSEGIASLPINLNPGTYSITSVNPVTGEECKNSLKVLQMTLKLESKNIEMHYKDGTAYKVTLKDTNGNPQTGKTITLILNGKTFKNLKYNRVTDNNGIATLPINLSPGEYTITAVYETLSTITQISVKNPSNSLRAEDIEMHYKDGTAYKVTLKDQSGQPLPEQVISLYLDGKTFKNLKYDRITDSNGIATLPINLSPGEYTITAVFNNIKTTTTIKVLPKEN